MVSRPLLWITRTAAFTGLTALTLTGEAALLYLLPAWFALGVSLKLDELPEWGQGVRKAEPYLAVWMIGLFVLNVFLLKRSLFLSVAHFLLLFQTLKALGLKTRKDSLQILTLSFFQVLSACTLSTGLWLGVVFLIFIPLAVFGQFWQQIDRESERSQSVFPDSLNRSAFRWMSGVSVLCVPFVIGLTLAVFIVFPRSSMQFLLPGISGPLSGYTEQVSLTRTGALGLNHSPVLWLKLSELDRKRWDGYLRGAAMNSFNGKTWNRLIIRKGRVIHFEPGNYFTIRPFHPKAFGHTLLDQTITLVNPYTPALFAIPAPVRVHVRAKTLTFEPDGSIRWSGESSKPLRYEVQSDPSAAAFLDEPPESIDLRLPPIDFSRVRTLSKSIAPGLPPILRARAIESWLRANCRYSLTLGTQAPDNPVEHFLFETRSGHCEQFASAMAVMLRMEGIPSRVVGGFRGGEWNTLSSQSLIRASDAHAWVEGWIEGSGWTRFDPTPGITLTMTGGRAFRLKQYWDYLNYKWVEWVLDYDLHSQVRIALGAWELSHRAGHRWSKWMERWEDFGRSAPEREWNPGDVSLQKPAWKGIRGILSAALALILLIGLWKFRAGGVRESSEYRRFLKRMAGKGFPKQEWETGMEFLRRISAARPSLTEEADPVTRRYYQERFRGEAAGKPC